MTRSGMTMVELLVVIAVIAILAGLLVPGLQVARESSRRAACGNNLRQIAFAMAGYGDSRSYLPGWRNSIKPFSTVRAGVSPSEATVSWTVLILPQIEETTVHNWYTTSMAEADAIAGPPASSIAPYACPSQGDFTTPTPLSYAVNAGTGAEILGQDGFPPTQYAADGVFLDAVGNTASDPMYDVGRRTYAAARISMRQLSSGANDGTAVTVMLSERSGPFVPKDISWAMNPRVSREHRGAVAGKHAILQPLPIGSGARTEIQVINPTEATRPLPSPVPVGADLNDWNLRYPSSHHPGNVNAAFCDGHVRVLHDEIDAWVYCQLLSSAGDAASAGVRDWQQKVTETGGLVPYRFNAADLKR